MKQLWSGCWLVLWALRFSSSFDFSKEFFFGVWEVPRLEALTPKADWMLKLSPAFDRGDFQPDEGSFDSKWQNPTLANLDKRNEFTGKSAVY